MKEDGGTRLLAAAVLVSLVLHLLLFYVLPILREEREPASPAPPLQARLVEPAPAPAAVPELPRAEPRSEPAAAPRKTTPRPAAAAKPAPAAPAAPVPAEPVQPAASPEAKPAPAALAPALSAPPLASAAPAGTAQEISTVAQYRIALMRAMARDQSYPRLARDNGWEGRVRMRVAIGPGGAIAALEVLSGAGYEVLDRRALEMVQRAQPQTPVPGALLGREFAFEVPVIFSLKDAR